VIYSTFIAAEFLAQTGSRTPGEPPSVQTPQVPALTPLLPASLAERAHLWRLDRHRHNQSSGVFSQLEWRCFSGGHCSQCSTASQCNILAVDPNLKTPYVTNWDLGVQHAFNNNLSLEVGYVGTHGSRLTGFRDLNQADSTGTQKYNDPTKTPYFPGLNFINQISNDGRSNYHSLQATLTKRTSHGLSFTTGTRTDMASTTVP